MKRRLFIKRNALATGSLMIPEFLQAFDRSNLLSTIGQKKLIVIQLSGGCDGLSAVIPYRNDIYYAARKKLAIPQNNVLKLDDEMAFNPVMTGMKSLYDKGYLSILNNVGYPNANRSHFRSMDIWHSASNENEIWSNGWLGRYMDSTCENNYKAHQLLEMDDTLSLAMKGNAYHGMAVTNINMLHTTIQSGRVRELNKINEQQQHTEALHYLYKTLASTTSSVDYLKAQSKIYSSNVMYPPGQFGKRLKSIGELIVSGVNTSVYYASLSGFDTHANQKGKLERLLKQLSDGSNALVKDLEKHNKFDECAILIFSEFGRRVEENSSNGTDHGAGNNVYIISNQLRKAGIFNGSTDLHNLDKGDVRYKVDFREIYAGILNQWLEVDDTKILKRTYKAVDLFS